MPSGVADNLRPTADSPWSTDELVASITIKLSEDSDTPEYVKTITLSNMENMREVQIRLLKDADGEFIPKTLDEVRF